MEHRLKTNLKNWTTMVFYIEVPFEHCRKNSASESGHFLKFHALSFYTKPALEFSAISIQILKMKTYENLFKNLKIPENVFTLGKNNFTTWSFSSFIFDIT